MLDEKAFKVCPCCFTTWESRDHFLTDQRLELTGYKFDSKNLEYGLFFFTHKTDNCFSTMAIEVNAFLDLFPGVRYSENKGLTDSCPRYCFNEKQLSRCSALCECAFAREIIQVIREKQGHTPEAPERVAES